MLDTIQHSKEHASRLRNNRYDKSKWPWKYVRRKRLPVPDPYESTLLREKLRMSERQLAEILGVFYEDVFLWENASTGRLMPQRCIKTFRKMQSLADHVMARRMKPDWNL